MEHTLGVVKMCDYFAGFYAGLNRDLLVSAAMFHDIGKMKELSVFPENDYTDDGQLLGHIVIGTEIYRADPADRGISQKTGIRIKALYFEPSWRAGVRIPEEAGPFGGIGP